MAIRVTVADDEPHLRAALVDLIASDPAMEVIGEACDAPEAIDLATRLRPDVAVIDVRMPGGGEQAARAILRHSPNTRVIALSAFDDHGSVMDMVRAGATSYVVKGSGGDEILTTIRRAARGQGTLSAEVAAEVVRELSLRLEEDQGAVERMEEIRGRLRCLIDGGHFAVHFQPIVRLANDEICGVEALLRPRMEPVRGPAAWFADAAEVGMEAELELAALAAALEARARIPARIFLAVNISPAVLLLPRAQALLSSVSGDGLVIEITEHARVADYAELTGAIDRLRAGGVRLAVDDAGAGFASLRHILQLRPNLIKLDIELTHGIERDRAKRAMAAALIAFAEEMGMAIVAEGIETAGELGALRALGATLGQGYFLGRPQSLAGLLTLVGA